MSLHQALEALEEFPAPYFLWTEGEKCGVPNARWRAAFCTSQEWAEVIHPEDRLLWAQFCGQLQHENPRTSLRFQARLKAHSEWKRCLISAEKLAASDSATWLLGATDIEDVVERIEADCEQERVALRMTARQWSSFFQESATGKAMIGLSGDFLVVNPELCHLLGYSEADLLQMTPQQLRHPDDFARIDAVYQALLAGGPAVSGVSMRYLRSDGQVLYALVSLSLVTDSRQQPLYFAVELQDDTARRLAVAALEEKMRELATSNENLERSNAELERFAFVASHDLQEPLRKIRIFAGRLQNEANKVHITEASRDYLSRLSASADRMQQLIADLLEFSRLRRPPRFETVDLTAVAREAAADFDALVDDVGASIEIGPLPTVEGDRSRLGQLFCNLIGNALKFRGTAAPQVKIWAQPFADSLQTPFCWEIFVSDNGIGFDESDLPRLLEVFGRIHPRDVYPGTGIGLAICRKVVQEHGGDLSARSEVGKGATFIFSLPSVQKKSAASNHDEVPH